MTAVTEFDVRLDDGQVVHAYDTGGGPHGDARNDRLAVCWHHGTPNIGAPPRPLFDASERLSLRWFSFDRPGYGGSSPVPDRDIAVGARYAAAVADALGIERFAAVGHSGGSSHALACGGLLPDRVVGVVSMAALAPFGAEGLDWFSGMAASGVASLQAAAAGRAAKVGFETSGQEYDPEFTERDLAALAGDWAWLVEVVRPALAAGPGGLIDDDLAYVKPWGCDPADIRAPTLLVHGDRDRVVPPAHGAWLAARVPDAELRPSAGDGHISVLDQAASGLDWLRSVT